MSLVLDALTRHARERGDQIAVTDGLSQLSYRALPALIEKLAQDLAVGLPLAGPIASCLDNSAAWVLLDLALIKLERPSLPLPKFLSQAQRAHAIAQSGAGALVTDEPADGLELIDQLHIGARSVYLYALDTGPVGLPPGTAKITYTSGSTGTPKGVCLSQTALERVASSLIEAIGPQFAGIHCAVLPLGILLENTAGLYTTLIAGGRYDVPPLARIGFEKPFMPDFGIMLDHLISCEVTSTILVPELLRGLMMTLAATGVRLPSMKLIAVGGAKVSPSLIASAAQMGLPVFEGYGLSEAASVVAVNTPAMSRPGSVGRLLPHAQMTFGDDGELMIANSGFLGYVGGDPAPALFKTGDIASLDDDGFLYIEGRKSNTLITAFGRNISPEWVESELLAEPQIGQAMVFGEAQPALAALIVPSARHVTANDISKAVSQANKRLPAYARIEHWTMAMPFTPASGQLTSNGRMRRPAIAQANHTSMARCYETKGQYVSFFETLVAETAAQRMYLEETPQIQAGLMGQISLQTYLDYLAQAYYHVKHTVPLMSLTYDKLTSSEAWLRPVLEHYMSEELGHELWILDDIENSGGNADMVRNGTPRLATEVMVAYAYDFITRINPIGFFGMVFVLEGTSTQLASQGATALMQTLNLPETCFRYLLSHGSLDLEHMAFLKSLLDRIESPQDQAAVIHMAQAMFVLFANVFRAIPHQTAPHVAA